MPKLSEMQWKRPIVLTQAAFVLHAVWFRHSSTSANRNNNNEAILPYSTCKMLHDELECSLALTHIVLIYTIKLNMANKYKI